MSTEYLIRVVNRKYHEGEDGFYIGRPTPLGNPFSVKQYGREEAIKKYKNWLNLQYSTGNKVVIARLHQLAQHLKQHGEIILECWCAPDPCHGEIIAKALLNIIDKKLIPEVREGDKYAA